MSQKNATAISQTPSRYGKFSSFLEPGAIAKSSPATPAGVLNQALLFHEALHGFSGLYDKALIGSSLESIFNIDISEPSCKITNYLELKIWGGTIDTCQ